MIPALPEDCFTGCRAFTQARGRPFVFWLNCALENAAMAHEIDTVRLSQAWSEIRTLLQRIDIAAGAALDKANRQRAEFAEKDKGLPADKQRKVPPVNLAWSEPRIVLVKDDKKSSDKSIIEQLCACGELDTHGEMALRLRAAKANVRGPTPDVSGLIQPGAYHPLTAERAERIQSAARKVCAELGMAKADIEDRGQVTFFPLARGRFSRDTVARDRWAVMAFIQESGEAAVHGHYKRDIERSITQDGIDAAPPKRGKD